MYCTSCGNKLELGFKFCNQCGKITEYGNSSVTGKINISRVKKFFACLISFDVYVDNTYVGKLANGGSLSCDVTLTNHTIVFKSTEKDVVQDVVLNNNSQQVTIEIVPKMGFIAARPCIDKINYS